MPNIFKYSKFQIFFSQVKLPSSDAPQPPPSTHLYPCQSANHLPPSLHPLIFPTYGLAQNRAFFDQIHSELSFFNMAKKRSNESKNSANGQRKSRRIIGAPVASIAVEQPRIDVLNGKKGKEPHRTRVSLALTPSAAKKGQLPDDHFLQTPPDTPQKEPDPGTPFELDDSSDEESKEMIGIKAGQ